MVKIITDGPNPHIEAHGDMMDIVAEIGYAIGLINDMFETSGNPDAAELFRGAMHAATAMDSPIWEATVQGVSIVQVKEKSDTPTDQS